MDLFLFHLNGYKYYTCQCIQCYIAKIICIDPVEASVSETECIVTLSLDAA